MPSALSSSNSLCHIKAPKLPVSQHEQGCPSSQTSENRFTWRFTVSSGTDQALRTLWCYWKLVATVQVAVHLDRHSLVPLPQPRTRSPEPEGTFFIALRVPNSRSSHSFLPPDLHVPRRSAAFETIIIHSDPCFTAWTVPHPLTQADTALPSFYCPSSPE